MKELHDEANLRVENEVKRKQEEYDMFQKQKDEEYQRMIKIIIHFIKIEKIPS